MIDLSFSSASASQGEMVRGRTDKSDARHRFSGFAIT
jgi:hypothetical protein